MSEYDSHFRQLAKDALVPTTEDEINAEFDKVRTDSGLTITNANAFGPFWRFVKAAATTAAAWLIEFVITSVLPQAFVITATGVYLDIHARAVGLTRKSATKAIGVIAFNRASTSGTLIIPIGTVIQSISIDGHTYKLITTAEGVFNDTVASINIAVEAMGTGEAYNLAGGYYTVLVAAIEGVTVLNAPDWLTSPGANQEKNEDLRSRIKNQYSAVGQWHTDAVYRSIITSFKSVTIDNVYFDHEPIRKNGGADAYILLNTGNAPQSFIDEIQSEITDKGNHGHGDDLKIFPMPETTHNVVATVWPIAGLSASENTALLNNVEQFIRCAFRENTDYKPTQTLPWDFFSFSLLSQELHDQFPNLKNVGFDLTHIDSAMDIPRLNTLTVNQHA